MWSRTARFCAVNDPDDTATRHLLAIGHALTGQELVVGTDSAPAGDGLQDVIGWLAGQGWDADRLRRHRQRCQAEHLAWPHPVPGELVDSWGRLHSVLQQLRQELGLDGLQPRVRTGPQVIGPDERRLLADKPPHHL